jgi:hypothetical protein
VSAALSVFQLIAPVLFMLAMGCESERPAAGMTAAPQPRPQQAQQTPPTRAVRSSLCLELEGPRRPVMLGEPVTLIASVVNCSSEVQQVPYPLSPDFGFLQLWLQPPSGPELLHRPVTKRETRKPVSLAPGERLSEFAPVYFGSDGWTIRQPGRYRARAEYAVDTGKLQSKPVEFTVLAPETPADRQAAELMLSREVGSLLLTGRDQGGKGSERLAAIEQQYGQSRLAAYARLERAVAASHGGFDPQTKTFRKDECDRVVEQLATAIPQVADPLLASRGTTALIRCWRSAGRGAEADKAASSFLRLHPGARDVPAVRQMRGAARKE